MGPLELSVMESLWERHPQPAATVHEVAARLPRPLAYNTVMTTLDRLFKKGLLTRDKRDRAYVYSPSLTRAEWRRQQAETLISGFVSSAGRDLLVSCLVDAVGHYDAALLDDLEQRIRLKRQELP